MTHRLVRYEYFFVADHRPNTFDDDGFYDGLLVFGVRLVGDGISVSVLCWTVVLVCDGGGSVCLFRRLFFFFSIVRSLVLEQPLGILIFV